MLISHISDYLDLYYIYALENEEIDNEDYQIDNDDYLEYMIISLLYLFI